MSPAHAANELAATTVTAQVVVSRYDREVLDPDPHAAMRMIETRLEERFSGGLTAVGVATHLRIERQDGSETLICYERITGELGGRRGSFLLQASGYADRRRQVHGRWEIIAGSGTDELADVRGYAAFSAAPDPKSGAGWSATTALTYWFEA